MRRLGGTIVLAMIVVGCALLALAMHRYPGGTEIDRHCVGHSFWLNFLCDLTGEQALNGAPNGGHVFARAAMMAFAFGMGAFWLILPAEFSGHRVVAAVVRVGGALSVLGFLSVPIAPGPWHAVAVFMAAIPGVIAAGVSLYATVRFVDDRLLMGGAIASLAATVVDSVLYAARVMDDYRSCPPSLPVFQRLTLIFVLVWAGTTALRAIRPTVDVRSRPRDAN
ncbi:MAG TPA: hypothetical protein VH560_03120 [Polyangia bacterium]|nr:hypothetical protein [Polyangia bacterium]